MVETTVGSRLWTWPDDISPFRADVTRMLAASVEDAGILGFGSAVTQEQGDAFYDDLRGGVRDGSTLVLIGTDGEGVCAMCVVHLNAMTNCRHLAEVSKAYLAPRVRRSGAVDELVGAVCVQLAHAGIERLLIDVREDSPAHRVWKAFGFITFGVLEDYARHDGVSHRGHYMTVTVADLTRTAEERGRIRHRHTQPSP